MDDINKMDDSKPKTSLEKATAIIFYLTDALIQRA